jgi:hypothetical protein
VSRLVGVVVAGWCLGRDCKLEGKGRNRLSLTQPTTLPGHGSVLTEAAAADGCSFGRVEQGGGTITLTLHMQAACRRQPLKKDLCM